jgi:LAO/AO transport system kinase
MKAPFNILETYDALLQGNKAALGKAITLIESTKNEDKEKALDLLGKCAMQARKSIVIGVTGVPGVGKSTFIEGFGKYLIEEKGKKVAVLAIDPSSQQSRGSILGDKTRMNELAVMENAFIRPSASGSSLGGVARTTRQTITLCETAGYDVILVETVGVGQSETTVKQLCDFFLLLMLYGAGDELQGIKRGIMEMADCLFINKADQNETMAKAAAKEYSNALHLFPPKESEWYPKVLLGSGLNARGIEKVWEKMLEFQDQTKKNGFWDINRKAQEKWWFKEYSKHLLINQIAQTQDWKEREKDLQRKLEGEEINALEAAKELVNSITSRIKD